MRYILYICISAHFSFNLLNLFVMKTRSLFLWVVSLFLGVTNLLAQDVQEKIPSTLSGVWQMCFYRSSSPNVVGELKTGNSLKILSDDGRFINLVMMQTGAIIIGYGTYKQESENSYTEYVEKNLHLPQLNGEKNVMQFELEENGNLMLVKYYLKTDRNGNKIDSWCHEIWKRVEMPSAYPENIIR